MQYNLKNPKLIAFMIAMSLGIAGLGIYSTSIFAAPAEIDHENHQNIETEKSNSPGDISFETAGNRAGEASENSNNSWPGEIISHSDAQIYPSREGQIAAWKIKIGDTVKKGQVLGRLNPPPASLELTSLLAEKQWAITMARAQSLATIKLVQTSKDRLKEIQNALVRSRDSAISVTENEAVQNVTASDGANKELVALKINREATIQSAEAELAQAEAILPIKFNVARAAFERLAQRMAGAVSLTGAVGTGSNWELTRFNPAFGSLTNRTSSIDMQSPTLSEYISSLRIFLAALEDKKSLPENEAHEYIKAAKQLISTTSATADLTQARIEEIKDMILDDEENLHEALKDYLEAETDLSVKKAKLTKMTAEMDRELTAAETTAENSQVLVEATESFRQYQIADADKEYAKEKADLDLKIAELDRELELANAQVAAAGSAYGVVASGGGSVNIIAPSAGVVSAIYKNVGDFVSTDTAVSMISSKDANGKFVRFRIPSDLKLPKVGDEVSIEKPGFPFNPQKAKITGVGLALDENGSYQAEAKFIEPVDWAVKTSVRVIITQMEQSITVPLISIWWNDAGKSNLWVLTDKNTLEARVVKVGRAVGDRVEVEAGLEQGEKFVSVSKPEYKEGQSFAEASGKAEEQNTTQEKTDSTDTKNMSGMEGMEGMDHEGH